MAMSDMYGPSDESESIATIQAAIDSGVNLLDTGDFYGMGHNEMLIRRAIEGRRKDVFLAVKFGALRGPDGAFIGHDMRPPAIRNFLTYSLRRLGTDYIDLYQPCRVDPHTPIEEVVGAIADLVKAGYVRHIGLSEASSSTIRRANSVHPISALQIEYSIVSRGIEADILPAVRELGISVTAYGVLSRGLLSGSPITSPKDMRNRFPRFLGENLDKNRKLVDALNAIAASKNATAPQIAIAWVMSRGADINSLDRSAAAQTIGGIPSRARSETDSRRPGPHRVRDTRRRRRGNALLGRTDAPSRQRKARKQDVIRIRVEGSLENCPMGSGPRGRLDGRIDSRCALARLAFHSRDMARDVRLAGRCDCQLGAVFSFSQVQ